jgi:hypothetical protein
LGWYDLPAEIDDGLYMVGGDDDFGRIYDIRAIASRTEQMRKIHPDYVMSDAEMEQFKRPT